MVKERRAEPILGFNINFLNFQEALYGAEGVHPDVIRHLRQLPGMTYRYPGGLVANAFDWEAAIGETKTRRDQLILERLPAAPVRFGPEEYLRFCHAVGGRAFYVLNLVGWTARQPAPEMDTATLAASNARLAAWRVEREKDTSFRVYQLGNELDRAKYEWPHSKYLERCRATMDAVRKVEPQARFIAFLRDFNWRYRSRTGVSRADDFAHDVFRGLPLLDDYSVNVYYDAAQEGRKTGIPHRLAMIRQLAAQVRSLTGGRAGLWITEHARQLPDGQGSGSIVDTSGIEGAVSAADFILAVAPLPELQGILWHALGIGKWSLFVKSGDAVAPTPVYWAMRLLHAVSQGAVLDCRLESSNLSAYEGGYDCRAQAFREIDGAIRVAMVNRHAAPMQGRLQYPPWAQLQAVASMSFVCDAAANEDERMSMKVNFNEGTPDDLVQFGRQGELDITIPPRSVCTIKLSLRR